MKRWIGILIGIIIISMFYIKSINKSNDSIVDRENILEAKTFNEHTIFIEKIRKDEYQLKIYDETNNKEEKINIIGNIYGVKWSNDGKYFLVNEGTDMIKTTYIISLEDINKIISLRTVGEIVWSPDSSKLLIGIENNKKRATKTELEGTVDLALYYIGSETVETLLEADQYTDFWPISWDEDNNINYRKIKGENIENLILKYEPSNEEKIMNIINLEESNKNLKNAIDLLPHVDFNKLEKIYGEDSVFKILHWISQQTIVEEEDILFLIKFSDDFIGEEYYAFIEILGNAYINDKIKFIKALAKVPERTEEIAYALNDLRIYDRPKEDLFQDLSMIYNTEELTDEERTVGIELINYYAACGT